MPILVDSQHRNVPTVSPIDLFKNAPKKANTLPLVSLPVFEPGAGSPASSPGTPPATLSADKPDNHGLSPDMCREDIRLKTFDKWPLTFLSPQTLARNGFYYLGRGDEVRCAFCKVEIMRWEEGDDPAKDHQRWAPQCPFLRKHGVTGNVPIDPAEAVGHDECGVRAPPTGASVYMPGPVHPKYASESARLRTFKDWPKSMRQKPEELAEAGFYYTGHSDKTKCFYCDGGLKDWESHDIPWEQHARWFDRCAYVQLVKGRDYVQKVISEACVVPEEKEATSAPKPEPATTASSTNDDSDTLEDSKLCKICYAEERNVVFVPCGHVVACAKCAMSTNKCPMCRRTFTSAVRLYYS
ncbi:hypothetical protein MSG28_009727 [Choristoneura fumiferana]|uniref:Uncharacterized protein n=1 Tax=Choristoneura fumiferana TaxID=7141 RepID=A0ACC0JC89_CHOFU|nr:hypothetical protein MSG28_009727 [Choristoneura fumiferana]